MLKPVFRNGFNPPSYVSSKEAFSLFHFMVTGKPLQQDYYDRRNKVIHNAIENMYKNAWENINTETLIYDLNEQRQLEKAGGETHIRRYIGNIDPERDMEFVNG